MGKFAVIVPSQEPSNKEIGGRYVLSSTLGRGGMGVVWRATDNLLKREVAVKEVEIPSSLSAQERDSLRARVLREARAAAQLSHPGAVTIFDVHEDDGMAYIVMELVDAPSLSDTIASNGPLAPSKAAALALALYDALEAAHVRGIVHRDVKPANVMVGSEGRVKLADFGIASIQGDPKITSSGVILGSPAFMAPEQAKGETSGPETDLWGLGATLYYAVEGRPPFEAESPIATLNAVLNDDPAPIQHAGEMSELIAALLDKEPAARPSGAELRGALQTLAHGRDALDRESTAPLAPSKISRPKKTHPSISPTGPGTPRHSPTRALFWLAVVGLIAAAAIALFASRTDDPRGDERAGRAPAEQAEVTVPDGWIDYDLGDTGASIAYPPSWDVVEQPIDADSVDFRDPDSSTYLRVDWRDDPLPDAVQAWIDLEARFRETHANYERIRISPTEFKGFEGAVWEFTYTDGGADLHAIDLGFVTGDYGMALNFQTKASEWEESQELFQQLKAAFDPPS